MLTHSELIHRFAYSPDTGLFTRLRAGNRKQKIGVVVGATSKKGYVNISIDSVPYPAHRLAWFYTHKYWPVGEIDHINRNPRDNMIANLRDVDVWQNAQNRAPRSERGVRKDSKSGFRGVVQTTSGKWRAYIRICYVNRTLGLFATPQDAAEAVRKAELFL